MASIANGGILRPDFEQLHAVKRLFARREGDKRTGASVCASQYVSGKLTRNRLGIVYAEIAKSALLGNDAETAVFVHPGISAGRPRKSDCSGDQSKTAHWFPLCGCKIELGGDCGK